ncbi:MAG: palmitoyltransferase pfa5 [Lasallia pustulata]|uniref:Palmitoyltransferase n=1 Tax=Lasallia pustulata TaxID=136370 RepID=A0A5M8PZS6_9LECA|nr:MAG: palmitoyltransferase pfa5 [Lasallia pustulata]
MAYDQKAANVWTARVIPFVLIGIVAYSTWVIVAQVCVDYLLKPSKYAAKTRPGAAIAILVFYCLLLLLVAITYFRLLYTVLVHPAYTPRGPQYYANKTEAANGRPSRSAMRPAANTILDEKLDSSGTHEGKENGELEGNAYPSRLTATGRGTDLEATAPGLEQFYTKDVFVCEGDGRPIWCSTCLNWKPDRTHHCREVQRCVRKMDHFCPWVGGIVSETNFKFFVLFVAWAAIYCFFALVVMAVFVAERKKAGYGFNAHWLVVLGFAAFFGSFNLGMFATSFQFILVNTTTVENLSRHTKVYTLAIYMPNPPAPASTSFQTITYPLPTQPRRSSLNTNGPSVPSTPPRTFAILHSKPGESPWDLGPRRNFRSVMGEKWWDCILPLKYSPCCNHSRGDSAFEMGPVVARMRERAGIAVPRSGNSSRTPSRRRRRRSKQQPDEEEGGIARSHRHRRRRPSEHRRSVHADGARDEADDGVV